MIREWRIVNRSQLRKFVLEMAESKFGDRFTRVSSNVMESAEELLTDWVIDRINMQGPNGKTVN